MQLKIYERVDKVTIWFYFLLGIALLVISIWGLVNKDGIVGVIFFLALSLGSFAIGTKFLKDRNKGKLNSYTIKCEKYEEI